MLKIGMLAGAAALMAGAPAFAQAPVAGTTTQPGAWGAQGWQHGAAAPAATAPAPAAGPAMSPAPAPGTVQMAAAPAPVAAPMLPDAPEREHRWMTPGAKVPKRWRDPRYTVVDWQTYGFGQPGPGMRWMRYYDDAALIDDRGRVVDVRHDIPWDAPRGPAYAAAPMPAYAPPPLPTPGTVRTGPHTVVTTTVTTVPTPYQAGAAYYGGQIVSVTPGYVITTTTRSTQTISRRSRATRSKIVRR